MYTMVMENREFPYGGAYCRGMVMAPDDSKTICTTASCDGAVLPGTDHKGAAFRTRDVGETWEQLDVGEVPYRNVSAITLDQAAPSHVYCLSGMGRVYSSHDGGDTFSISQVPHELLPVPNLYSTTIAAG